MTKKKNEISIIRSSAVEYLTGKKSVTRIFRVTDLKATISVCNKNEGKLIEEATCKDFLQVRQEASCSVARKQYTDKHK